MSEKERVQELMSHPQWAAETDLENRLRLDYIKQKLSLGPDHEKYLEFNIYLSGKIDAINELEQKRSIIKGA